MNELSEFFSSVAKEKKKVEEEKIRFTPRVNVNLTDLSSFFGTITEAKREHVVIAKRDSTKLNALKGFFDRLDKFETALQENIEKQKEDRETTPATRQHLAAPLISHEAQCVDVFQYVGNV